MDQVHNEDLTPKEAIDALEQIQGKFPGARRAHAKGICMRQHFFQMGMLYPIRLRPIFIEKQFLLLLVFPIAP